MILVIFTAVYPREGICSDISYGNPSIDYCLEFLTDLVNRGCQLVEVNLVVDGKITRLPVEAFDGQSMLKPLDRLREQWQAILSRPD